MKIIFFIFFLSFFSNLANANDEDWIFLRCVISSDNIKYFEVSVSREMMIERNGYQFTFTRLTPFLIQAELNGLAKISLHTLYPTSPEAPVTPTFILPDIS